MRFWGERTIEAAHVQDPVGRVDFWTQDLDRRERALLFVAAFLLFFNVGWMKVLGTACMALGIGIQYLHRPERGAPAGLEPAGGAPAGPGLRPSPSLEGGRLPVSAVE